MGKISIEFLRDNPVDVEEYVCPMGEEVIPFSHKTDKNSRAGFFEDLEVKKLFLFQDTLALMESRGNRRASKKNDVKLLN